MERFANVCQALEARGYTVRTFADARAAADYLDQAIDGRSVGMGGSITLQQLEIHDRLAAHNTVHWHWTDGPEARTPAMQTDVYLTSVNGLAETGEIVNIDGAGNRAASTLYGHKKVYLIAGRNKLAETLDKAIYRARNIAAPLNAQRLQRKTPCAGRAEQCFDCRSPERICRALVVLFGPMMGMETEVILVDQDLGY